MKESLEKFYEYLDSDEELCYFVRMNAEWNEESFCKMKRFVKGVVDDYAEEDVIPKIIVRYFMLEIPSVINMLSQFQVCTEENIREGYTQETYMSMIADKIKQLEKFKWEFMKRLEFSV